MAEQIVNEHDVLINVVELASELAEKEMEDSRGLGEVNTIEDENGCIVYTEEAQDIFNDLYDKYYELILSCKSN